MCSSFPLPPPPALVDVLFAPPAGAHTRPCSPHPQGLTRAPEPPTPRDSHAPLYPPPPMLRWTFCLPLRSAWVRWHLPGSWTCPTWRCWCWTRPTACLTWGSRRRYCRVGYCTGVLKGVWGTGYSTICGYCGGGAGAGRGLGQHRPFQAPLPSLSTWWSTDPHSTFPTSPPGRACAHPSPSQAPTTPFLPWCAGGRCAGGVHTPGHRAGTLQRNAAGAGATPRRNAHTALHDIRLTLSQCPRS